jgi:hypothetical protein
MEPLSILNPPVTDLLNDPRVTSQGLLRMIDEQQETIMRQLKEMSAQVKKEDINPFELMMFACLQHHLHITTVNTKLTVRQTDLAYVTSQLNLTLEKLTKWLIGLTVVLAILAVPLTIDVVLKWLK